MDDNGRLSEGFPTIDQGDLDVVTERKREREREREREKVAITGLFRTDRCPDQRRVWLPDDQRCGLFLLSPLGGVGLWSNFGDDERPKLSPLALSVYLSLSLSLCVCVCAFSL